MATLVSLLLQKKYYSVTMVFLEVPWFLHNLMDICYRGFSKG